MKREAATAWTCACANPDVEYDQCTLTNPFKSLKQGETKDHEDAHRAFIEWYEAQMAMMVNIENVIGPELRIGTWDDWKDLLNATKAFARFEHEHQGVYGQPFFINGASDNLERAVRNLIWYQTIEGKVIGDSRRMGAVHQTLDALFRDIQRRGERKRSPKPSFSARLATAKVLWEKIDEAAEAITKKFPGAEGLSDLWSKLEICQWQMENELQKFHAEKL